MTQLRAQRTAWAYTVALPYYLPTLNSRLHWARRARTVRGIRDATYVQTLGERRALRVPLAKHKRRLTLTLLRGPRQRLMDIDGVYAALKPVVDGLKDAGWIVDDSPAWLDYTALQEIDRATGPAVRVEIEET